MSRWVQNKSIACRVIDGTAILIRPDSAHVKALNRTGTRIWELLAEPRSLEELADDLCGRFEIDRETALADAKAFLEELRAKGLVDAA